MVTSQFLQYSIAFYYGNNDFIVCINDWIIDGT